MQHSFVGEPQDGWYRVVRGPDGKRLTPLVGLKMSYKDLAGAEKQYVGEIYVNSTLLELSQAVLTHPLFSMPIKFYQQDDPYVASDVLRGNVFWSPEDNWQSLIKKMYDAQDFMLAY